MLEVYCDVNTSFRYILDLDDMDYIKLTLVVLIDLVIANINSTMLNIAVDSLLEYFIIDRIETIYDKRA